MSPVTVTTAGKDAATTKVRPVPATITVEVVPPVTAVADIDVDDPEVPAATTVEAVPPMRVAAASGVANSEDAGRCDETTTPAAQFVQKVTKKIDAIVPTPVVQKRRKKSTGAVSMPRRSRRITNLPPETDRASASTVCRKLGLTSEEGRISDECHDQYVESYKHRPECGCTAALSMLFAWEVPSEGELIAAASHGIVV
ncbi:unnamed protein product [Urochloa humidicola]